MITLGVIKEKCLGENRVSLIPKSVQILCKLGFLVNIQKNAGLLAGFSNEEYKKYGAIVTDYVTVLKSNIIIGIYFYNFFFKYLLHNSIVICLSFEDNYENYKNIFIKKQITLISLDNLSRTSSSQSFDVLSSISNVAGYRAVIEAIYIYKRFFSRQITAAGETPCAKVLILGMSIAGLSAVSVAKSLGAEVFCYDINKNSSKSAKSLGAKFLFLNDLNMYLLKEIHNFDIIICCVSSFKKTFKCPNLITLNIIKLMKKNSVIVDLAMRNGGNCELSVLNKCYFYKNKVHILGYLDFSNLMPSLTSELYSNNIINFIKLLYSNDINNIFALLKKLGESNILLTTQGTYRKNIQSIKNLKYKKQNDFVKYCLKKISIFPLVMFIFIFLLFIPPLYGFNNLNILYYFVILLFSFIIGYITISKIDFFLHTPLISFTNAISGIIAVGSLIQLSMFDNCYVNLISLMSLLLSSISIFSGFFITYKMIKIINYKQ